MNAIVDLVSALLEAHDNPAIKDPVQHAVNKVSGHPLDKEIPQDIRESAVYFYNDFLAYKAQAESEDLVIEAHELLAAHSYFSHRSDCSDPVLAAMRRVSGFPNLLLTDEQRADAKAAIAFQAGRDQNEDSPCDCPRCVARNMCNDAIDKAQNAPGTDTVQ